VKVAHGVRGKPDVIPHASKQDLHTCCAIRGVFTDSTSKKQNRATRVYSVICPSSALHTALADTCCLAARWELCPHFLENYAFLTETKQLIPL